jgi:ribosome-associated protein
LEVKELETRTLADQILDVISDHFGEDIILLDIQQVSTLADFFVIASATSERQMEALIEALLALRTLQGRSPRLEGDTASGWVLLDYGDVVAHIFSPEKRRHYRLEEIWRSAPVLVRVQ